jgi:lipid-binding SYLF domain-containing protein
MRLHTRLFTALAGIVLAIGAAGAHAQAREEGKLLLASQVLEELRDAGDRSIPNWLLERAYGIAVIPDMTKIAFFAGGRRGNGVLVFRDKDGRFTNPIFVTLTGGSFGFQWGVQSTDIVLVFTTRKSVEGISGGKITLGGDASVSAGPVGRESSAATDFTFKSEIYSYSRSRGVFAGLAIDGSVMSIDDDENEAFYGKTSYGKRGVSASDIVAGAVTPPANDNSAQRFMTAVTTSTRGQQSASAAPPPSAAAAPAPAQPSAPQQPSPLSSTSGAQSFPAEDSHPGAEPAPH